MRNQQVFQRLPTVAFGLHIGAVVTIDGEACMIERCNPSGSVTFEAFETARRFALTKEQFDQKRLKGEIIVGSEDIISSVKSDIAAAEKSFVHEVLSPAYPNLKRLDEGVYRAEFVHALNSIPRGQRTDERLSAEFWLVHEAKRAAFSHIAKIWQGKVPARSTVYKWRADCEGTPCPRTLMPSSSRRGGEYSRFLPEIEDLLLGLIEKCHFRRKRESIKDSCGTIHKSLSDAAKLRPDLANAKIPSKGTIRRRINMYGGRRRLQREEGSRASRLAYDGVQQGPNYRYVNGCWEIDATQTDIYVLNKEKTKVIGRPYLVMIVDHVTRMIVGFHLTMEPINAEAVLAAMRMAMQPKTQGYLARFRVRTVWIAEGIPTYIACDRGLEYLSEKVTASLSRLGIERIEMPSYAAHFKGRVERIFRTFNDLLFHRLAGTTRGRKRNRGEPAPETLAKISFPELEALLVRKICDTYHQRRHRALERSPLAVWKELASEQKLRTYRSADDLKFATMSIVQSVVQRQGIEVNSIWYAGPVLWRIRDKAHAEHRQNPRIDVHVDPGDISTIYVEDPGTHEMVPVRSVDAQKNEGVSLKSHQLARREIRDAAKAEESPDLIEAEFQQAEDIHRLNSGRGLRIPRNSEKNPSKRKPQKSPVSKRRLSSPSSGKNKGKSIPDDFIPDMPVTDLDT
jgi:putative transposase